MTNPEFKFYFSFLGTTRECNPLGKVIFTTAPESGQKFFRTKLNAKLKFINDDFKLLYALENSSDRCNPVNFIVDRLDGETYFLFWEGVFAVNDCIWDWDRCEVEAAIAVNDKYTKFLEEYEKEYNLLELQETITVNAKFDFKKNFEFVIAIDGLPVDQQEELHVGLLIFIPSGLEIYFREVINTDIINGEAEEPRGSGWIKLEETGTSAKWVRVPQIGGFEPYDLGLFTPDLIVVDCGQGAPNGFLKIVDFRDNQDCITFIGLGSKTIFWQFGAFQYTRNRPLVSSLKWLINKVDSTVFPVDTQLISLFFESPVNPATGETNYLFSLAQKSDVKRPKASEAATKGMISLKQLLEDLRIMFNVHWFINDEGTFQIEHDSYFTSPDVTDTTLPEYPFNKGKRRYEYNKAKMPRYEKLTFSEAGQDPFAESTVEYLGQCVNKKEGENTQEYAVARIMTDLESLALAPDDYGDTGFVLMHTYVSAPYDVISEFNDSKGELTPNFHLSAVGLMQRYWRHGRVMSAGLMNGNPVEFYTVQKTKKQSGLLIKYCPGFILNPFAKVKTELSSDADLSTAVFDIRTGFIELEVLHRTADDLPPFFEEAEFTTDFSLDFTS